MRQDGPLRDCIQTEFPRFEQSWSVGEVLQRIRQAGLPHKVIYLYIVDGTEGLKGVLPVRKLLTSPVEAKVGEICLTNVVSLRDNIKVSEAREAFARHRYLAFPVVDAAHKLVGVVDIESFAGDLGDFGERRNMDEVFELLGFSFEGNGRPLKVAGRRFIWLLSTMAAGTTAAFFTGFFEATLKQAVGLAFFLALVLGLNESVAMQSAGQSIHALRGRLSSFSAYLKAVLVEIRVGFVLGVLSALTVGVISYLWRGNALESGIIAASLTVSLAISCVWGVTVPHLLHAYKRDPKVAAAPLALGLADVSTVLIYFSVASWMLKS